MNLINKLFVWYGKKTVLIVSTIVLILLIIGATSIFGKDSEPMPAEVKKTTEVETKQVRNMMSSNSFTAVGKVEAVTEAVLQTEAGGRVTAVNFEIGDTVRAGAILATLENNSERASLLQAEGAYEVAQAGAAQSDSGLRDAETGLLSAKDSARTAARDAYTAVDNALITTINQFYSSPLSSVPGVRVSGDTTFLSSERVAFQTLMPTWQESLTKSSVDEHALLGSAEKNLVRTVALIDSLLITTSEAKNSETLLGLPLVSYSDGLLASRGVLNAMLSRVQGTGSALTSAEEAVLRASIASTGGNLSVADAQVKIALGSLRAAQANYEKTLVRTPISGVINALYLKAGEYVVPGQPSAIVANNNGLEVRTAISQEESLQTKIGDTITIEGMATGTVSAIGGAVDPSTGKVALTISIDEGSAVQNGSTVSVLFDSKQGQQSAATEIVIPLSAVKMTGSGPVIFTVKSEDSSLSALSVVLGPISGENVVVSSGITVDMTIVVDARGLKDGQVVTVVSK